MKHANADWMQPRSDEEQDESTSRYDDEMNDWKRFVSIVADKVSRAHVESLKRSAETVQAKTTVSTTTVKTSFGLGKGGCDVRVRF